MKWNLDEKDCVHLAMAVFPGCLALVRVITPMQAASLVIIVYWLYRMNTWQKQKKAELEEEKAKEAKRKEEEEALLALPAKKRKNVLKAIAKREAAAAPGSTGGDDERDLQTN